MLLTLFRLVFSPLVIPLLLVYVLPFNLLWLNSVLAIIFGLLSLTDFFDGYLARRYKQETTIGKILDPLADKFLTYATLVGLLAAGKIFFYWVVILIGREFFIVGLRQAALEYDFSITVSHLGKVKTFLLLLTMAVIIINPYQSLGLQAMYWNGCETILIGLTLFLSILSAYHYYVSFMKQFGEKITISFKEKDINE